MRRNILARLIAAATANGLSVGMFEPNHEEALKAFSQKVEPQLPPFWREPKQKATYPKAPKTLRK